MKPAFLAPRRLLERKPPHGAACTSCGLCCLATRCRLSVLVYGDGPGPCPAVRFDALESSSCNVVADPTAYRPGGDAAELRAAALLLIRAGTACDARFNGEARDAAFDAREDAREAATALDTARAIRAWFAP